MTTGNFLVYKSSAGSGKTTTLVMEYLKIVLQHPGKFNNILALTFTNKAANEMKERVIRSLHQLANIDPALKNRDFMLEKLTGETGLDVKELKEQAGIVLQNILHNYSQFAIGTIDSFVHRIIRSFAFDLNIPANFEVELDTRGLIDQAVDFLISRVGEDEQLTKALINFTHEKTAEEKSWDVQRDLQDFAYTLTSEDSRPYINKLRELKLDDFENIRQKINKQLRFFETRVAGYGEEAMSIIKNAGLCGDEFYQANKGIGTYFRNLAGKRFTEDLFKLYPNTYVVRTIEADNWYSKSAGADNKEKINSVKQQLTRIYNEIKGYIDEQASSYIVYDMLRSQLYSMAVLHEISSLLDDIKQQQQILPISEFNERIAGIVLEQPVPFVYERVGEKYQHYLIDEFQDTSVLQWQNLTPLLDNSLSNDQFNLVVGDGKQAIYRWRNGEVEQFLQLPALYRKKPGSFQDDREQTLKQHYKEEILDHNFRSLDKIVQFNNDFFTSIAPLLPDKEYQQLYEEAHQKTAGKGDKGYVQIEFLPKLPREELRKLNIERVESTIKELLTEGYQYRDIAILCRSNADASEIARTLLSNGVNVISAESLLLKSSPEVSFLTALLSLLINRENKVMLAEVINYLAGKQKISTADIHRELSLIGKGEQQEGQQTLDFEKEIRTFPNFMEILKRNKLTFPVETLRYLPLYDLCETLIRNFGLNENPDAYLQFFLDAVLDYTNKRSASLEDFLEWWSMEREKRSVVIPEGTDAVNVLTIHKAKGLQYPVVIYPMATMGIKKSNEAVWVDFQDTKIPDLPVAMLPLSNKLERTSFVGHYEEEKRKSALDFVNLLYVAMTRPVEQLYIFTDQPSKTVREPKSVADFFRWYLKKKNKWKDEISLYEFGEKPSAIAKIENAVTGQYVPDHWITSDWRKSIMIKGRAPDFWDTDDPAAGRDWGNLVHAALAGIKAPGDTSRVINALFEEGLIDGEQKEALHETIGNLISREEIRPFFEPELDVRNESEILIPGGASYRPDRIVFKEKEVWVIDYKTGEQHKNHQKQINRYASLLKQMGYPAVRMFLIYVDSEKPLVEVNDS